MSDNGVGVLITELGVRKSNVQIEYIRGFLVLSEDNFLNRSSIFEDDLVQNFAFTYLKQESFICGHSDTLVSNIKRVSKHKHFRIKVEIMSLDKMLRRFDDNNILLRNIALREMNEVLFSKEV